MQELGQDCTTGDSLQRENETHPDTADGEKPPNNLWSAHLVPGTLCMPLELLASKVTFLLCP